MAKLQIVITPGTIDPGGVAQVEAVLTEVPPAQDVGIVVDIPALGLSGSGVVHVNAANIGDPTATATAGTIVETANPLVWEFHA